METRTYTQRTDIHGLKQGKKIPKATYDTKKKIGKTGKLRTSYSLRAVCKITALFGGVFKVLFEIRIYLSVNY